MTLRFPNLNVATIGQAEVSHIRGEREIPMIGGGKLAQYLGGLLGDDVPCLECPYRGAVLGI